MNVTEEPRSAKKAGSEDGIGERKQPSRAWALGGEGQVLGENPHSVGQGRLPAEVVPEVSLGGMRPQRHRRAGWDSRGGQRMFWSEEGRPAPRPQSHLEPVPRSPGGVGIVRVPWEPLGISGARVECLGAGRSGDGVRVGRLCQSVQARHRGAWGSGRKSPCI